MGWRKTVSLHMIMHSLFVAFVGSMNKALTFNHDERQASHDNHDSWSAYSRCSLRWAIGDAPCNAKYTPRPGYSTVPRIQSHQRYAFS